MYVVHQDWDIEAFPHLWALGSTFMLQTCKAGLVYALKSGHYNYKGFTFTGYQSGDSLRYSLLPCDPLAQDTNSVSS